MDRQWALRDPARPHSIGGLETVFGEIIRRLGERRFVFRNRERLELVFDLMALDMARLATERRFREIIRARLLANAGRPLRSRRALDDHGLSSLYDDQFTVEVRGLDVYDPTTGVLRSASVDDIAAWFLDTNYDGDAFFVRHAYFTGADDPYDKLKHALRADIDEAAWASLNSATSRPFPKPSTGRIAVKVINHYGDEVMKIVRP